MGSCLVSKDLCDEDAQREAEQEPCVQSPRQRSEAGWRRGVLLSELLTALAAAVHSGTVFSTSAGCKLRLL